LFGQEVLPLSNKAAHELLNFTSNRISFKGFAKEQFAFALFQWWYVNRINELNYTLHEVDITVTWNY
jgi:hypothetical protein